MNKLQQYIADKDSKAERLEQEEVRINNLSDLARTIYDNITWTNSLEGIELAAVCNQFQGDEFITPFTDREGSQLHIDYVKRLERIYGKDNEFVSKVRGLWDYVLSLPQHIGKTSPFGIQTTKLEEMLRKLQARTLSEKEYDFFVNTPVGELVDNWLFDKAVEDLESQSRSTI